MKMTLSRKVYEPLPVNDADNDGSSEKLLGADETTVSPKAASHRSPWIMHLGIFSLYTITFLGLSAHFFDRNPKRLKDGCLLEQSMYSPVHEVVEYSVVRFNGSLDISSPYKGHPSAALDEAWDRITTNNSLWPMRISDKDLEKINKGGRGSNVKYREIDGGGNMASVEVFHQLHCLNMLRKYTYPKEYPELHELWKTQPKFIRGHLGMIFAFKMELKADCRLDHCIDMIRQNLMCVADVGMISYDWISGWDVPFPDFNTYHKCRNFDAILDWATKHRVRIPQDHMGRIGNEINLPEPPI